LGTNPSLSTPSTYLKTVTMPKPKNKDEKRLNIDCQNGKRQELGWKKEEQVRGEGPGKAKEKPDHGKGGDEQSVQRKITNVVEQNLTRNKNAKSHLPKNLKGWINSNDTDQ